MTTDRRGPSVYVTVDEERGVALVRGRAAEEALFAVAPNLFQWSESGRGWAVPLRVADDIAAWAQTGGLLCVVHARRQR